MNFNLQKLASAIADAPATVESGKLYRKLDAYHIFRWVFWLHFSRTIGVYTRFSGKTFQQGTWVLMSIHSIIRWLYQCMIVRSLPVSNYVIMSRKVAL